MDRICLLGGFMLYQFQHFGISEYFCKEYGENFNFPVHLHQSFEFIVVLDGEMEITVDSDIYTLSKGESVLIFPHQMHSLSSHNSKHMLCIFSPELVQAYASKVIDKKPSNNVVLLNQYLIDTLDELAEDSSTYEKKAILYSICAEFAKKAEYAKRLSYDENLFQIIFKFVDENYSSDCSLSDLSKKTGYSYCYLSRCFKKTIGISFNAYVNRYRIDKACTLLNNTNCSILQCALDSGYKSVRNFNRNFVNVLGVTPKEYRDKCNLQ